MDISRKGNIVVKEEQGFPYGIKVRISKSLMEDKLVVGLEDLKSLHILHKDFPKTLPRDSRHRFNRIRGAEEAEEQEKARGMLLYLEEWHELVDNNIANFSTFPEAIKVVLAEYHNVFNSQLEKSMNMEPARLNVVKGRDRQACFTCRPAPIH